MVSRVHSAARMELIVRAMFGVTWQVPWWLHKILIFAGLQLFRAYNITAIQLCYSFGRFRVSAKTKLIPGAILIDLHLFYVLRALVLASIVISECPSLIGAHGNWGGFPNPLRNFLIDCSLKIAFVLLLD